VFEAMLKFQEWAQEIKGRRTGWRSS